MTSMTTGADQMDRVIPFAPRRPQPTPREVGGRRPAGQATLRLTRRGRAVVVALALMIAVAAGSVAQQASAGTPGEAVPVTAYTVASGETLWRIAGEIAEPGQDVREVVDELIELNGLTASGLHVGQQLLVPAS